MIYSALTYSAYVQKFTSSCKNPLPEAAKLFKILWFYHYRKQKNFSEAVEAVPLEDASSATSSEDHVTALSMCRKKFYLQG